jgi:hypothetical protein
MSDRVKKIHPIIVGDVNPNQLFLGTPIAGHPKTDPDGIYRNPSGSIVGGLQLDQGKDYEPYYWIRGFRIHGVQTDAVLMVEYPNGSIGRYDNINIASGGGWAQESGILIKKILCSAKGSTATGVVPTF